MQYNAITTPSDTKITMLDLESSLLRVCEFCYSIRSLLVVYIRIVKNL